MLSNLPSERLPSFIRSCLHRATNCMSAELVVGEQWQSISIILKATQYQKLWASGTPDQIRAADTWGKWIHLLDSHLLGLSQATFIGMAVMENSFVGACAGDSRAYLS